MKKNILIITVVMLMLSSCIGVETPLMTEDKPFIVGSIDEYDNKNCRYVGKFFYLFSELIATRPSIIAPKGMFNIGDTIKVYNQRKMINVVYSE